jgi:hypothetical protein
MSAAELLRQLEAAGLEFHLDGDNIEVSDVGDVLTLEVVNTLRAHKPELVSLLARSEGAARAPAEAKPAPPLSANGHEGADPSGFVVFDVGGLEIPIEVGFAERCCPWWASHASRLLLDAREYINGGRFHLTSRDELLLFLGEYCRKRAAGYDGVFLDEMMAPWLRSS